MTVLLTLVAALSVAGAVYVSWWLGVWGFLTVLRARVETLEGDVEFLRQRNRREDGRQGRRVQVQQQSKEDRELEVLEEMAARERKRSPPSNGDADYEELPAGRA